MAALTAPAGASRPVPWVYARAQLAARWGVPPWEVDEAPRDEVAVALDLIDAEAQARRILARRERRS